jgi:hypothetical protein
LRPRISQAEAKYLVAVLQSQLEEMREKLCNVEQLERDLTRIIYDLKNPVQPQYDERGYRIENRLIGPQETVCYVRIAKQLKEDHPDLLGEKFRLWTCISTHEKLLMKYTAIAEGQPHDGRYKRFSTQTQWRFKSEPHKLLATLIK